MIIRPTAVKPLVASIKDFTMSQNQQPVYVSLEFTPNPNTLKYSVNRTLLKTRKAANFTQLADATEKSPLAASLMKVEGIRGVMIGADFVTVTKSEDGDWDVVHKSTSTLLEDFLTKGEVPVYEEKMTGPGGASTGTGTDIEERIKEILDAEIRPAVAMDGGDIIFDRFEAGVVYLQMHGSCAGCPSSTATLKQGVEARLREALPDVLEVVAV
jgi:Fe-S cluster biogenesis protein NfuA